MSSQQPYKVKRYFSLSLEHKEAETLSSYLKATGQDLDSFVQSLVIKVLSTKKKQNSF